jgi:hypothetical protein
MTNIVTFAEVSIGIKQEGAGVNGVDGRLQPNLLILLRKVQSSRFKVQGSKSRA